MPESRTSCWTISQKNKDPYLRAWVDEIPTTTCEKAVWEYDRKDKVFRPFKWDGLTINPSIPYNEVDLIFRNIKTQLEEHPSIKFQYYLLYYVLLVHLPLILFGTYLYCKAMIPEDSNRRSLALTLYLSFVLSLSAFLIVISLYLKHKYLENLKRRQTEIEKLLDALNIGILTRYRIRAVAGKFGAWIELQFLTPETFMVRGGQPSFGNYNQPLSFPSPAMYGQQSPSANPFNP